MFNKLLCSYTQPLLPEQSQEDYLCVKVTLDYQSPDSKRSHLLIDYYLKSDRFTYNDTHAGYTTVGLYIDGKKIISTTPHLSTMKRGDRYVFLTQQEVIVDHTNSTTLSDGIYYRKTSHFRAILNPGSSQTYLRDEDGVEYSLNNQDCIIEFDLELPDIHQTKVVIANAPTMYDRNLYTLSYGCVIGVDSTKPDGTVMSNSTYRSVKAWVEIDGYRFFERSLPVAEKTDSGRDYLNYSFNITDEELQPVRALMHNRLDNTAIFVIETWDRITGQYLYDTAEIRYSIIHDHPIIDDIVINEYFDDVFEKTGDRDIIVKHEGTVVYGFKPTAMKEATIVRTTFSNGAETIENLEHGFMDNIQSPTFIITATDSRGLTTTRKVTKPFIDYLKPTCYQKITGHIRDEVGIHFNVRIFGDAYNGSFGVVNNNLKIYIKHTQPDGTMGDWTLLTNELTPELDGNTYKLDVEITNPDLSYIGSYTFQSRVIDEFNTVISSSTTISIEPMFDWSNEDFNFNVPINMHEKTILRHNRDGDHTVLSATGGRIHLRPNGTDDETGETIFYPDGSIKIFGQTLTSSGFGVADSGSEPMGTNGTWTWIKWEDGRAECWGVRNFGTTSVQIAYGSLYRSGTFNQKLPTDLFVATPNVINITLNSMSSSSTQASGCWIARFESVAPTKTDTGSFIIAAPYAINVSTPMIGFHVMGRWKELEEG